MEPRSRPGGDIGRSADVDPSPPRRWAEPFFLEEHRPDPGRRGFPRHRPGQPRARRQRPLPRRELHRRCAVRRHAAGARADRAAGGPIGASMGGMTGLLAAHAAGPEKVTKLVLVDVVPRYEKDGSARIRDFMFSHVHGFESLDEAADAVAAYLPHRTKPRSPEGLKKNLRRRDGRWYWHWDPKFLTAPMDDPFVRVEKLERAAINLTIPILLIRGKLSDVVSTEGVQDFLAKVPNAEFVELSDAGHTAAGDDNDAFSEVVVQFASR